MKPMILLPVAAALLVGADTPKYDAAAREVEQSLRALNAAFARHDAAAMRRLLAADHVSITPYYGMLGPEAQLKALGEWQVSDYREADLKVTLLTEDTARVTFRLTARGTYKGKSLPATSYAVSIWANRDGRWQEVSYQETPMDGE